MMAVENKDSPAVTEFMALFSRLKDWCDDLPDDLVELTQKDSSVAELCSRLWFAASGLTSNERRRRCLFAAPVDPKFLAAFRDFEERYQHILTHLELQTLIGEFSPTDVPQKLDRQRRWDHADVEAASQATAINSAIAYAKLNVEHDRQWDGFDEDVAEQIADGAAAWERLCQDTGFDLRRVFRRRTLVPFVLVPRKVAAKHGSAEKLSLLTNLHQAQEAFVFGVPFAALALMRSVMESVLRDHYRANGNDLRERIENAYKHRLLPRNINARSLHKLRDLSNAILHMDKQKDVGLQAMNEAQLELEILALLELLRDLIERL